MKKFILAFFFTINLLAYSSPTVIYIMQGGSTTADGLSWGNAVTLNRGRALVNFYKNQNPALETEIWAKAGTYNLTSDAFQLTIPIKMYGGFAGNETALEQRNCYTNQSIITQTVADKGVLFSNSEVDVVVDGFILQNGNKSTAGACGSLYPGVTLRNCIIRNNKTTTAGVFQLNGVAGSAKKFIFENCLIINNEAALESMVFQLTANTQVDIINCTIANNLSTSATANVIGINSSTGVVLNLYNSLIFGNKVGKKPAEIVSSINAVKNLSNNAWDVDSQNATSTGTVVLKSTPFISTTPYVGAANGVDKLLSVIFAADFNLKASSGCVNKGNNSFVGTSSDLKSSARIINSTVDIGSYESNFNTYPVITAQDVLSVNNGVYFLDGSEFAEIGWNKFDICWMFWDELAAGRQLTETNEMVVKQRNSIRELAEAGVKTIRFFGCVHEGKFPAWLSSYNDTLKHESAWLPLDKALDICEQYNIRAIVSLMCENFVDRSTSDNLRELVSDSLSASRSFLYKYIDEATARYKNRKGLLAWEVSNEMSNKCDIQPGTRVNAEGERLPTLAQLSLFYKQVGRRLKTVDTLRMVTSGGSYLREMAYGLSIIPMSATSVPWPLNRDTYTQYKNMYKLVYDDSEFDNVDIHFYMRKAPNYQIRANDGSDFVMNELRFNTMMTSIGKPLMLGEYGALPKVRTNPDYWVTGQDWFETFEGETDSAQMYVQDACDRAVNSGCRLIYWWCYDSHRPQDQNDPQRMDLDVERTPILFQKVLDANRRLKQKFSITTLNPVKNTVTMPIKAIGNRLYFSDEFKGELCRVYNSQGALFKQFIINNNNETFPKGFYIVNVAGNTIKLFN